MAVTDNLPAIEDPREINRQATAAYLRGLPTAGQTFNQEYSFAGAPQFGPGAIGHGGVPEAAPPTPGSRPAGTYPATPILTRPNIPGIEGPARAINKTGTENAWNALDARYRAQDTPPEVPAAPAINVPSFPDTIAGRIARQSYGIQQHEINKQTELGLKGQEAETAKQNMYSESALRVMQGRALGSGHLAEVNKQKMHDEYLDPNTPEDRRDRIGHILGVIKPENVIPEKDELGRFTGRSFDTVTKALSGGPTIAPLPNHIAALKAGTVTPQQFDEKYGPGASKRYQGS
jgi:hypothetical protein